MAIIISCTRYYFSHALPVHFVRDEKPRSGFSFWCLPLLTARRHCDWIHGKREIIQACYLMSNCVTFSNTLHSTFFEILSLFGKHRRMGLTCWLPVLYIDKPTMSLGSRWQANIQIVFQRCWQSVALGVAPSRSPTLEPSFSPSAFSLFSAFCRYNYERSRQELQSNGTLFIYIYIYIYIRCNSILSKRVSDESGSTAEPHVLLGLIFHHFTLRIMC